MNLYFFHEFERCVDSLQESSLLHFNGTEWSILIVKEAEAIVVFLFGGLQNGYARSSLKWNIMADFHVIIDDIVVQKLKVEFSENAPDHCRFRERFVIEQQTDDMYEDSEILNNKDILVEVELSNIRTDRARCFELPDFENATLTSADFTISIGIKKFHCHSQMLQLSSPVFQRMMNNLKEKQLEIVLDEGISVNDFGEFLHQIYFPLETIDDYNLEFLLHLGRKYEVAQILFACQHLLRDCFLETDEKKQKKQLFILVWRYDLPMLKWDWLRTLYPSVTIAMITDLMKEEHYQLMHEEHKVELLEILSLKLS